MIKQPAFMFYTGDWIQDTRFLSLAAKGAWIDLLCAMWRAQTRGTLSLTWLGYSRLIGAAVEQTKSVIVELVDSGICDCIFDDNNKAKRGDILKCEKNITLMSRRMIRESEEKKKNALRQAKFREKGGGSPERWTAIRIKILERDNYMCAYCGRRANTVDHVIPKTQGGDESENNLVACCKRCNNKKNNRIPEEANMRFWKGFQNVSLILHQNNIKITPASSNSVSLSKNIESDKSLSPACPHKEIIRLYHEILPELTHILEWKGQRTKNLAARWKESKERQNLDWWRGFFESKVKMSSFLMGKKTDFQADLRWLVKYENFIKVLEGRYFDRKGQKTQIKTEEINNKFNPLDCLKCKHHMAFGKDKYMAECMHPASKGDRQKAMKRLMIKYNPLFTETMFQWPEKFSIHWLIDCEGFER